MFWGLTIEPGKHYSQTVDQSFHVSMAALDTREKSGMTQLLVRHDKAEFLLCTLHYGGDIPFPCLQQALNLNVAEGTEISFYSEGKGTIHMTGYLVTDNPVMEDPGLIAEANSLLIGSDDEEYYDSDEEDDDDDEDDEGSDSDMESASSQDAFNWQDLIKEFDREEDDSDEEEWTPDLAAKKKSSKKGGKEKKRKSEDDSISDDLSLGLYKKKRKAAMQAENLSKKEIEADGGVDDDDEDEDEEEDGDFIPDDILEGDDDDDDDEDEEEEEDEEEDELSDDEDDEEEEEEEEKTKSSPKKKVQATQSKDVKSPTTSPQKEKVQETRENSQKKKKKKKKKKQNKAGESAVVEGELPLKSLKTNNKENIQAKQKEKAAKKEQRTPAPKTPKKIKLPSGTTIEDLRVGEGKLAKPGKKVFMYYRGVLANNHKEFDSNLSGKPFMFSLGRGEVIKGWDAGVIGMKVGGKRRLIVPPSQGYGSQRTGPIPPNSTLIFDVELKSVR